MHRSMCSGQAISEVSPPITYPTSYPLIGADILRRVIVKQEPQVIVKQEPEEEYMPEPVKVSPKLKENPTYRPTPKAVPVIND